MTVLVGWDNHAGDPLNDCLRVVELSIPWCERISVLLHIFRHGEEMIVRADERGVVVFGVGDPHASDAAWEVAGKARSYNTTTRGTPTAYTPSWLVSCHLQTLCWAAVNEK